MSSLVLRFAERCSCPFHGREPTGEMNFPVVKGAWPALFPDLWFTFAIFDSSLHPLFNNCCSLHRPRKDGSLSQAFQLRELNPDPLA